MRVRFRGIDAPELRQTQGRECRQILIDATKSKTVTISTAGRDRYNRFIAELATATIPDLSLYLIEQGCAWEYSAPLSVKTSYQNAEQTARSNIVGLWADSCATPPWVFRASGYYSAEDCQP
jgi:endonuclease YncB( thermonuclease family)